jgi:hypothetical protein
METKEWIFHDKTAWGPGPWQDEPDKVQWEDPETKRPCLAVRNVHGSGGWCGYVAVLPGEPSYGKNDLDLEVHGGLTFSSFCAEDNKEHGICHIPGPGEPDKVWWLGFDCGHYGDLSPAMAARDKELGINPVAEEVYRDLEYLKEQCHELAKQLGPNPDKCPM